MRNPMLPRVILMLGLFLLLALSHGSFFFAKSTPNTIRVPQDYSTIQSAVAAASPGDTILVSPSPGSTGTYDGNITITKSLTLIGTSANTVIVNATSAGPGFVIKKTSGVRISGFTVEFSQNFYSEVTVISSSNVVLTGNIFKNNPSVQGPNGTIVRNSNGVVLRGNTITGNLYGVGIQGGYGNIVQGNNITGNQVSGIILGSTTGNQIKNNFLRKAQSGLEMYSSKGNVVEGNLAIANNTVTGISMVDSANNLIVSNSIDFNNSSNTIGVRLQNATGNGFYYNNIRNNTVQFFGVFLPSDLTLNIWNDSATNPRGNFWSDYNGVDNNKDGVGDTRVPWPCPGGGRPCSNGGPAGVDFFPLMNATKPSILNVTAAGAPLIGCGLPSPLVVNFNSTALGGASPYQFSWSFGDGMLGGNFSQLVHGYATRGHVFATLNVGDSSFPKNMASDIVPVTLYSGSLVLRVSGDDGSLVEGANVVFVSQTANVTIPGVLTDRQGAASFSCLPPGTYDIQGSKSGFHSGQTHVVIADSAVTGRLTLVREFPIAYLIYAGIGGLVAAVLLGLWYVRGRRAKLRGNRSF